MNLLESEGTILKENYRTIQYENQQLRQYIIHPPSRLLDSQGEIMYSQPILGSISSQSSIELLPQTPYLLSLMTRLRDENTLGPDFTQTTNQVARMLIQQGMIGNHNMHFQLIGI